MAAKALFKPMFQLQRSTLLQFSSRKLTNASLTISSRRQQSSTVTVTIDNTPIDLNLSSDSSQTLQNVLDSVNAASSNSNYTSNIDATQTLNDIFENNSTLQLSSGDKQIIITHPSSIGSSKVQQELALLSSNLSKRLRDSDVLASLQAQSKKVDDDLQPMYDRLVSIEQAANSTTDKYLLGFLSAWTMCTIGIGRLTWWEYSWDIMEPVAWATQAGGFLFWGWYYYITRNENSMTDLNNRIRNKKFKKSLEKGNFDIEQYNDLVEKKKAIDYQIVKLRREF